MTDPATLVIYPDCRRLGCGAGDWGRCMFVATMTAPAIILSYTCAEG
jgi:hypothetical protein